MKKLLLALAIAGISSQASALSANLEGVISGVNATKGVQTGWDAASFTGAIDINSDAATAGFLTVNSFSFTIDETFVSTNTVTDFGGISTDVTYGAGGTYTFDVLPGDPGTQISSEGDIFTLTYNWGSSLNDSNDGAEFYGSADCSASHWSNPCQYLGDASLDGAELVVIAQVSDAADPLGSLVIQSITLNAFEEGKGLGDGLSTTTYQFQAVPVPGAAWLFGSALLGLGGIARRRKAA